MKVTITTSISLLLTLIIFSSLISWKTVGMTETLIGAWQQKSNDIKTVKILSAKHFMFASYNLKTKTFLSAGGGTWEIYEGKYRENIEYLTSDSTKVGSSIDYTQKHTGRNWMTATSESNPQLWEKIEEGETTPLTGVWRIREGK